MNNKFNNKNLRVYIILGIVLIFGFFYWFNGVNSWKYLFVGDEWSFYSYAKGLDYNHLPFLFSFKGVYDMNGVFPSFIQSICMHIFGMNNTGWRLSNILLIFPIGILLYKWVKNISNKRVALLSVILMSFSAVWSNYFKIGYVNPQAALYFVACFYFFDRLIKAPSLATAFIIGILLGLGFYTYIALSLPVILIPYFLIFICKYKRRSVKYVVTIIYIFTLLAYSGILESIGGSNNVISASSLITREFTDNIYLLLNPIKHFLVFFGEYGGNENHFVNGPLLDILSQIFFIIGLAVIFFRRRKLLPVVATYALTAIFLGITLIYSTVAVTRSFILCLFAFVICPAGIDFIYLFIRKRHKFISYSFLLISTAAIICLNIYNSNVGYFDQIGYTRKALAFNQIADFDTRPVVIVGTYGTLDSLSDIAFYPVPYGYPKKQITFLKLEDFKCESINRRSKYLIFSYDLNPEVGNCIQLVTVIKNT